MKKRIVYLDILRILACLGVIANHTNIILKRADIAIASVSRAELTGGILYMVLCKMAVTLFLMISGVLLLRKVDSYKKIFQRIIRIAVVLLVFSLGYYMMGDYTHTAADFIRTVTKTNVTTAFWYLYLYLGILVMLPVLQRMVRNFRKADYWYFFIFALGICSFSFITDYNAHFSLPVFATSVGIVLLGYYLDNFVDLEKYDFKLFVAAGCMGIVVITGFLYAYTYRGVINGSDTAYRLIVYDNVFYVALSIMVFLVVKYVTTASLDKTGHDVAGKGAARWTGLLSFAGSCTFGIYLFSDFFIRLLMPYFERWADTSDVYMLFIVILLDAAVFAAGFLVTALLKQIPVIKRFL